MAQPDQKPAALLSHFTVGSVSEENSEDEVLGRQEEKERSLSPSSSVSSDSTFEMGFDHVDEIGRASCRERV